MPGKSVNLTIFEISLTRAKARYTDDILYHTMCIFLPDVAYSLLADFTRPITPALLALYGDMPALPYSTIYIVKLRLNLLLIFW